MNLTKKSSKHLKNNEKPENKSQKRNPNDNLQKSSILFLQLGLILALTCTYYVFEIESKTKQLKDFTSELSPNDNYDITPPPTVIVYETNKPLEKQKAKPKFSKTDIKVVDDNTDITTTVLDTISRTLEDVDKVLNTLPDITDDEIIEPQPFILLEEVPVYPGCENMTNKEAKACFTKEISKFVNRKFNTGLAEELGLTGKQNIYVQFVIDKTGKIVDIKSRAPHTQLEKEAKRIIEKLPIITPGKQRNKPVPVKYTLPIKFQINY